ncbi:hypothetical protein [Janthinobacterium lividum]|nr:hypothetical protein [Janthinobacterium lividum]
MRIPFRVVVTSAAFSASRAKSSSVHDAFPAAHHDFLLTIDDGKVR